MAGSQVGDEQYLLAYQLDVYKRQALRRAAAATQEKLYIEHVTIYLYTHPEAFRVRLLPLPDALEGRLDLRFPLDTLEDFTLLQELYAAFCEQTDHSIHAPVSYTHLDVYKRQQRLSFYKRFPF